MTGVALLDLTEVYGSSLADVSYLITTRGVGNLLGSILGGKLHDTYNTQVVSILAMLASSVTVTMTALSGYLALAHVAVFLWGLSVASFRTGANVWIIRMWSENTSPPLQVLHLAFGIGGLLGPFVARPFLSTGTRGNATATNVAEIADPSWKYTSYSPVVLVEPWSHSSSGQNRGTTHVYCAFGIVGGFYLALTVSMVVLYFVDRSDIKEDAVSATHERPSDDNEPRIPVRFTRTVLAFMCIYSSVLVALEITTSQMLATFAVKSDLHFSKSSASGVEAMFFFGYVASRLTAAVVTIKMPVLWVVVLAHVILVPTAAVLVAFGATNATVFRVGAALTGIGQGPINAGLVSWTAGYISITNKMMSLSIVAAAIGSMTMPVIVGQFMDKNPNVFLYVSLAAVLLCVTIFNAMYTYVRRGPQLSNDKQLLVNAVDDARRDASS
ncbi:sodium-dependent glucose transporter 1-like [Dermacentor variabilis]|uniref:sodium-dependent glucose transporter 1-like n=1 Tax=Dermacentor variabilis TaxID=34621 RepID=UPI003F5BC362